LATFHDFEPLTCFACTNILQTENDNQIKTALTRADREDEEEFLFTGIPIAGENDGDAEESWERESWDKGDESETDNDSITKITPVFFLCTASISVRQMILLSASDLKRMGLFT
jgi:hypothetical protein